MPKTKYLPIHYLLKLRNYGNGAAMPLTFPFYWDHAIMLTIQLMIDLESLMGKVRIY